MAKQTDVNSIPATGTEAVYKLKEVLKLAGWTVTQSSDGSTYNGAGDQITSPGAGAGGMSNDGAWFDVREPSGAGGRTWSFQVITVASESWRIKMSAAAGFGVGTATQVGADNGDEVILCGGGTDASPTGGFTFPANGTYRVHIIAEDVAVGPVGNQCWGFWFFVTATGTGALSTWFAQEPMAVNSYPVLTGTRTSPIQGEADPCIYIREYDANAMTWNFANRSMNDPTWNDTPLQGWVAYGYPNTRGFYRNRSPSAYECNSTFGRRYLKNVGNAPFGVDVTFPIYVSNDGNESAFNAGWKGAMNFLRAAGTNRSYPDTINLSTDAYVYCGDLLVPWENGTAPQL